MKELIVKIERIERERRIISELQDTHLTQKKSKSQALREVQIDFIRKGRDNDLRIKSTSQKEPSLPSNLTHPYFWAPFYLVGHTGLL